MRPLAVSRAVSAGEAPIERRNVDQQQDGGVNTDDDPGSSGVSPERPSRGPQEIACILWMTDPGVRPGGAERAERSSTLPMRSPS